MQSKRKEPSPVIPPRICKSIKTDTMRSPLIIETYITSILLGKGGFGVCYKATRCSDSLEVAIKIIPKSAPSMKKSGAMTRLHNEINIMKRMSNPHIVQLLDNFQDNDNYYLILEICDKLSLNDLMKKRKDFTEPQIKYFIRQLLGVLIYLKGQKVIHRDVKPCNILLDKNLRIKLADFGLATDHNADNNQRFNVCGTPNFMAPEILTKQRYSYEVDMWASGIVTYSLVYGQYPFYSPDQKETSRKIQKLQYTFPSKRVSDEVKDLISKILVLEPLLRIKPEEALNHDFFLHQVPKYLPHSCYHTRPTQPFTFRKNTERKATEAVDKKKQKKSRQSSPQIEVTVKKTNKRSKQGDIQRGSLKKITEYMSPIPKKQQPKFADNMGREELKRQFEERKVYQGMGMQEESIDQGEDGQRVDETAFKIEVAQKIKMPPKQQIKLQKESELNIVEWISSHLGDSPYVVDFLDQSTRFGLCYLLSSRIRGIQFNDESIMAYDPSLKEVVYFEKHMSHLNLSSKFGLNTTPRNTILPVFKNSKYSQYVFRPSEIDGMHRDVGRKFRILEEYGRRCHLHSLRISNLLNLGPQHDLEKKEQESVYEAVEKEGDEAAVRNRQCEYVKYWVAYNHNGRNAYLILINDLIQVFFRKEKTLFILKRYPAVILYISDSERKVFKGDEDNMELKKYLKQDFQLLQCLLNHLLRKEKSNRTYY